MRKNGTSWQPFQQGLGAPRSQMGALMSKEQKQNMGLAMMSALSIAGLHSAICPSYFTMKTFASQPEGRSRAMEGLWISLGVSAAAAAALYFVFDDWVPPIAAAATALALFGISVAAINSKPPEGIPPIEKQNTTTEIQVPASLPPPVPAPLQV